MQISKAKWSRVKIKVARNLSWAEVQIGNFDVMPNELVTLKIKKAHENFESYVNFPGGIIAFDYSDRSYLPIGIRLIYGATDPSDYLFLKLYSPRRNK
ncbi:MAG TPA: hypothetical protein VE973_01800 [Candidatus Limnocylindria bacterium]|nr:hypothetical protein [Candidatus Limnocylindria bacterium]